MVKTRAANRLPALALADSAQHSGTPGARAHQRKNFNRAAAVAPAPAGGPGRASPGVLRRGCPAGASPPAGAGGRRWCALPGGRPGQCTANRPGSGRWGGWMGRHRGLPQPGGPFVGLRGHAAKPHLGHAEAGLPPIGQQGQRHAGGGRRGQGPPATTPQTAPVPKYGGGGDGGAGTQTWARIMGRVLPRVWQPGGTSLPWVKRKHAA